MALEENEKITRIETILEVEEEVKITPPARRKKAERMKNKSAGKLSSQACSDATKRTSLGEETESLVVATPNVDEHNLKTSTPELSPQVNTMNNAESHEGKNGMLENSWKEESCGDNEAPFGNSHENSFMNTNTTVDFESQLNSAATSKESEEVAEALSVLSDRKEDLKANRLENCVSPDITSGCTSQDEDSFYSAEEAETTASELISAPALPKLSEELNEQSVELQNHELVSSSNGEKGNLNEKTGVETLQQDTADLSKKQTFNTSECADKPLEILASTNKEKSCENRKTLSQINDKDSLSTETSLIDSNNIANRDVSATAVSIDSANSDLLSEKGIAAAAAAAATGGDLEADTESEEEWSSSSDTSSTEGEYDVDYFEIHHGIQRSGSRDDDSKDGLKEILLAFPSGTELVSVTTDSEDDSNRGDTPRKNFRDGEESLLDSSLLEGEDDSDTGLKMLACFSPEGECPVVVDDTTSEQEKVDVKIVHESRKNDDKLNNGTNAPLLESSLDEVSAHDNSDLSDINNAGLLDSIDGMPLQSTSVDSSSSKEEKNNLDKKRSGSFRLIKSNGSLKIVCETTVTKEDVKEARLKMQSVKGESSSSSSSQSVSNSTDAEEVLQSAVSEAKTINEEFKTICDHIASLDKATSEDAKGADSEHDARVNGGGNDSVDSGAVLVSVDSSVSEKQKMPTLNLQGVTVNESATEETGDCATEGKVDKRDEEDLFPFNNKKKQRPKVMLGKRYSLDTETNLLSPEDDTIELRNFGNSGSFKTRPSPCVSTEAQTTSAEATAVDGLEDTTATPLPPQRKISGRLIHSESFSPGFTRSVNHRQKEPYGKSLSKRPRSERRSKTLPNNVFVFDVFGAFKTSSSTPSSTPESVGPITLITDNLPANFPGFPIDRRAQVALELYTTERSYVRSLETILQLFKRPCEEQKLLEKKEITTMFLNCHDIFVVNKDLLFMLLERINHWHDHQCIGDIFLDQSFKIIERMKNYAKYCNNYDSAETLYKQKIKKSRDFEAFVNRCYEHPICQPGLNLPAYLIKVVQRIPRYLLLLENLLKRTPESHPDHGNLGKALTKMDNLAIYINNQLQTVVGLKAFEELRSRVMGLKAFEVAGRALIKEADVVVNSNKKTYKCLLFNDILVFGLRGVTKSNEFQKLELTTLWCMDLEDNNPQSGKEDSLEIFTPENSYIMYAGTKNEKKVWLQKLRTTIAMALHGPEATEKDEIDSRKAKFTYQDGRTFCGHFVSGKRNGEGTLSWPNQARYQGEWEDDDRCGLGELMYNSGDKYKGEWLDDKQHGVGTMEYMHGDVYHGQWYQGDMHGKGAITFKNGDRFDGDFYQNEIQGNGELRCVSGLAYRGEWRHSKKHGKGKMHFPNGDVYIGEFANDRISGQGEMKYADGSVYNGQWVDNQRGGQGKFRSPDGSHYFGGWSKDHINGKGCMHYSNGDCYDGNWFKNTRYGQGVMKYSNGDVYEGVFEYDLCSKFGKMTYKNGSVYEGNWDNGLRHGKGKMVYANKKTVFEGDWKYGMRFGEGVLTYTNGAGYRGQWELDKENGRGMFTDPSTSYHYEGEWKNGLKHGKGVEATKEGRYEGEWRDDMRHGQGTEILSCATEYEGRWKENRKHGPGTKKLKTGMTEEQVWHEGKQINVTSIVVAELPLIQRR